MRLHEGSSTVEAPPDEPAPGGLEASRAVFGTWVAFVVAALLLLDVVGGVAYAAVVASGAVALSIATSVWTGHGGRADRRDLVWSGALYLGVVGLFWLGFRMFTTERTAPMFLAFAGGMLLGTVAPIVYTVWGRRRDLASLGLGPQNIRSTVRLALLFAAVQFSITLWGFDLPVPSDWVPLLVMSLTVGAFESVFFRGFLQGRLESSFGRAPAVLAASVLYGAYHVGYGMGPDEIVFLSGLGIVYAIAYALSRNLLVLWPLLTPMGSLFAQLDSGELVGELPWASILGFVDVAALMVAALLLAGRRQRTVRRLEHEEVDHARS